MADIPLMNNPMTTSGDIVYGGASGVPTRLAKGTDAEVLTLASGVPSWASPAGGTGKLIVVNETVVAGSVAANIDFTSISGNYRHLLLEIQGRTNDAGTTLVMNMTFNNDTSANYDWHRMTLTNTTNAGAVSAGATSLRVGIMNGTGAGAANNAGSAVVHIQNYAATVFNKQVNATGNAFSGTTAATFISETSHGVWRSTAAITRITLTPSAGSWIIGSTATLYGLDN